MMKHLITLYKVPSDVLYIDRAKDITNWERLDEIDPKIPIILIINDSNYHYGKEMMLVYNNRIQTTGGGGSCYNPAHYEAKTRKYITDSIGTYWTKDFPYSPQYIWKRICAAKYDLLVKMGYKDRLPYWYWDIEEFHTGLFGILSAKLDAIGMGYADPSIIKEMKSRRSSLLLLS